MKYKSKISYWLNGSIVSIFSFLLLFFIWHKAWLGAALLFLVIGFFLSILLNTYYVIINAVLIIKCGFLYSHTIDIKSIISVKESNNILSSPALSFDRLEVKYIKWNTILISPTNKEDFINHLLRINPNIAVQIK
jgi:hypothetical protein